MKLIPLAILLFLTGANLGISANKKEFIVSLIASLIEWGLIIWAIQ